MSVVCLKKQPTVICNLQVLLICVMRVPANVKINVSHMYVSDPDYLLWHCLHIQVNVMFKVVKY